MSRHLTLGLFIVLALAAPAAAQEPRRAGTRYALLVGVDRYAQLQKLDSPRLT